jgi:hypothetical protein
MSPRQFIELLVKIYEPGGTFEIPPGASITIGHWIQLKGDPLPHFSGDVKITLTELKGMLNGTD